MAPKVFRPLSLFSVLTSTLLSSGARAQIPSASASAACSAISAAGIQTLSEVTDLLNPEFINAQSHYWSAANADLHPACAVFPTSVDQVSDTVNILQNITSVNFAVKSGGHNPNVGYSSTDGGVLISMSNISSTILSSDKATVDIGPGARWVNVAEALDGTGVTVVSGRLGKEVAIVVPYNTDLQCRRCWGWRVNFGRRFELLEC